MLYAHTDVEDHVTLDIAGIFNIPSNSTDISLDIKVPFKGIFSPGNVQLLYQFTGTNGDGQTIEINKLSHLIADNNTPLYEVQTLTSPNFTPSFINSIQTCKIFRATSLTDEDGVGVNSDGLESGFVLLGRDGSFPEDPLITFQINYQSEVDFDNPLANHKVKITNSSLINSF